MNDLLTTIRNCEICKEHLPLGPRPVLEASKRSKIVIIGQAPGTKVHASGIPWDDQSGKKLREWLGVDSEAFYDTNNFAIIPMGFCYPGKAKTGDKQPMKICAPTWHDQLWDELKEVKLKLLIGTYAQNYYLPKGICNLTEKVMHFEEYLPEYLVLPHPSPTNRFWRAKNPWFEEDVVPEIQKLVARILK